MSVLQRRQRNQGQRFRGHQTFEEMKVSEREILYRLESWKTDSPVNACLQLAMAEEGCVNRLGKCSSETYTLHRENI
jgi:hypothetical protein